MRNRSLARQLAALERQGPQANYRPPVLRLPENGREPPGHVEAQWRRFRQTGMCGNGLLIVPNTMGEQ